MEKRDLSTSGNDEKEFGSDMNQLSVMTYNVWSESHYFEERMLYIINIIKDSEPDVVSLIDVNSKSMSLINKHLAKIYLIFEVFSQNEDKSGCVLLCSKKTLTLQEDTQPFYYDYPKGSRVIGADLTHIQSGFQFSALATRLNDNPDNDHIRDAQCAVLQQVIKDIDHFIVMGDFNIYSHEENAVKRLNNINDTWVTLNCPIKIKYTFNGFNNPMINKDMALRNSRIYYHSKTKVFSPFIMSLVGINNIQDIKEEAVKPSLYYGLESKYNLVL